MSVSSEDHVTIPSDSVAKRRRVLLFFGAILWTLVFAALAWVWKSRAAATSLDANGVSTTSLGDAVSPAEPIHVEPEKPREPAKPIEAFALTERSGKTITNKDLEGHPWVAAFVFTRCATSCPMICLEFNKLQKKIEDTDAKLVSISVDPKHDTADVLREYADNFNADPERWYFLTGSQEDVYGLVTRGFNQYVKELFGDERKPGYEVAHTNRVVLVNAENIPVASYLATRDADMVRLRKILLGEVEFPKPVGPVPIPFSPEPGSDDGASGLNDDDAEAAALDENLLIFAAAGMVPSWVTNLPAVNAGLNSVATLLLCAGFIFIKTGRKDAHRNSMLLAFATSAVFLICYLTYHFALQHYTGSSSKRFEGTGTIRTVYFGILISHIVLAALVPVLAGITIFRAWKTNWPAHRKLARVALPIWLYVSVTGVAIYGMLYHLPVANSG